MRLKSVTTDTVDGGYTVVPASIRKLKISGDAKILYSLIYNRLRLSIKNGWQDEDGIPYCNYRREEMAEDAGIHVRKVDRCMLELKDAGLVQTVQEYGQKPRKIYLFEIVEDEKTPEKLSTETEKEPRQKCITKSGLPKEGTQNEQSGLPNLEKWVTESGKHSNKNNNNINNNYKPRVRARGSADAVPCELVDNFSELCRGRTEDEEDRIEEDDVRTNTNTKTPIVEDGRVKKMIDKRPQKALYSEHERALQKVKRIVTAKDRAELAAMIETHGADRVLLALETVRTRGTNIASTSYIRTMLKEDGSSSPGKRKPIDYATWGRAGSLGIQPAETRYTPEEMQAIIERKIAESAGEIYA